MGLRHKFDEYVIDYRSMVQLLLALPIGLVLLQNVALYLRYLCIKFDGEIERESLRISSIISD